ncbi:SRPBCC family protein [Crocosphaera sp. UHCC 0190]|uniref:SRPBCC family protein n=1 Tax=Crocosphaera sp. UHCC 0190 TaxID=3110246 RepID=UPI002B201F32|nr:SRPBCC family protein [Crocosphaera sp. UHCC 0190]MEA5508702.1 SRPBCC family protein [Crocosphaera sp. UHCC 0190]
MSSFQVFEQTIIINASATIVERCITDLDLMHLWLNPVLKCEPIREWSTKIGGRSRFIIKIPLINPTLISNVIEREPGLIVWQFTGFFKGRDRWECQPTSQGTKLINRFEFEIPNPLINWGFNQFAAPWTKSDMKAQLKRLKQVAEELYQVECS